MRQVVDARVLLYLPNFEVVRVAGKVRLSWTCPQKHLGLSYVVADTLVDAVSDAWKEHYFEHTRSWVNILAPTFPSVLDVWLFTNHAGEIAISMRLANDDGSDQAFMDALYPRLGRNRETTDLVRWRATVIGKEHPIFFPEDMKCLHRHTRKDKENTDVSTAL